MALTIQFNANDAEMLQNTKEKNVEHKKEKQTTDLKSIQASDLNFMGDTESIIEQKRNFARKQAMKLIGDAWGKDVEAADNIKKMQKERKDKVAEITDLKAKIQDIEAGKEALRQEYGVDSDSEEQKDLELLEKYQNNKNFSSYDEFSEEEIARLKELQNMPRTEYQKKALSLNGSEGGLKLLIEQGENELVGLARSIYDSEIEQSKSQEMLKAKDAANEITDAAEKEIFGILIKEGKDNIDEKVKEEEEKAEKEEEKREEQGQVKEKEEDNKQQADLIKADTKRKKMELNASLQNQPYSNVAEAQKSITRIMREHHLINEDLLGIEIDLNS